MQTIDWLIVAAFGVAIVIISIGTNRMTKSVAGFLSSERCAGRYLLTIANSMAFCSAIGTVGAFEGAYRNGITNAWWGLLMTPVGMVIALSGWVTYRYRETRCLTMAQFLEKRYSTNFRIFAGIIAFISGMLNCAVFPMVTAYLMMYFLGLPSHWPLFGLDIPMYHTIMLILVGSGVTLAIAGGQITIMVTDFLQGVIASAAVLCLIGFVLYKYGWTTIMDTLMQSENISALTAAAHTSPQWFVEATEPIRQIYASLTALDPNIFETLRDNREILDTLASNPDTAGQLEQVRQLGISQAVLDTIQSDVESVKLIVTQQYPDMIEKLKRPEGVSMMNPFKLGTMPDFGVPYFIMMAILFAAKTGIWQGGAGYMTAALSPHEAKMGGILGGWRWMLISLGTLAATAAAYTLIWNAMYGPEQEAVQQAISQIKDPHLQSQQFVPIILSQMLPAGLLGLFAIYMIGASVSTDDSAYHSWGSIFLQDVVMPFRKKPFEKEEHLRYLRWSIVGVGAFAFLFSCVWTLKDFIQMWFEITGAIYVGGASCAIIGGLYWKRGTTQGAWAGLLTGSILSVTSIVVKQIWPDMTFPGTDRIINGLHMAVFNVAVSYIVYISVSLATCREPFNLDRLLHRGKYDTKHEHVVRDKHGSWLLRKIGITPEFSTFDKFLYIAVIIWSLGWASAFIIGTAYNLTYEVPSEQWKKWWLVFFGVQGIMAVITGVWFAFGGARDVVRLYRKLLRIEVDETDDGFVREGK